MPLEGRVFTQPLPITVTYFFCLDNDLLSPTKTEVRLYFISTG
jgi:hypothetical protein